MKNLMWCLLLFTAYGMQAQDAYTILEAIRAVYADQSGLSYQVRYAYYQDQAATVPVETMEMTVATKGDAYYMQYNDYILIGDGKQHRVIDHLKRTIRSVPFQQRESSTEIRQFQEMAEAMGLQLQTFQPEDSAYGGLMFTAPDKSDSRIELVYDPDNFRLVSTSIRVVLPEELGRGYAFQNMRMEVVYSQYEVIKGRFPYRVADLERKFDDYLML